MKLTDFDTIADAKAWEQTRGQQISRNEMNALLAGAGIYVAFKHIAENDAHPFQNMIAAFLDATQYNFTQSDPIGAQNTAVLDAMIAAELPESPALTGAVSRSQAIAAAGTHKSGINASGRIARCGAVAAQGSAVVGWVSVGTESLSLAISRGGQVFFGSLLVRPIRNTSVVNISTVYSIGVEQ